VEYKYAYLIGILVTICPLWILLFWLRKELRPELLLISVYGGIAGPISQIWYIRDYWRPETITGWPISFEDVLFGFFIAGIASVAYEILFKKHFDEKRRKQAPHKRALAFAVIITIMIARFLSVNSIYDSFVLFLMIALTILFFRRDLFVDSVVSGCLMALCFLISYVIFLNLFPDAITKWWALRNISGLFVWKIPVEELLWAFGLGLALGPLYEFTTGKIFKR